MNRYPTARELAEEAMRVHLESPMTPLERWEFMIEKGLIDRQGRVLCNKLFGGGQPDDAAPAEGHQNGPPRAASE